MSSNRPESIPRDARVVVICVARIGDTLLVTPVLRAIKAACPDGELTCLAHPKRLDILRGLTCIDRLAGITKKTARWRGWLGKKQWDYALVYGHDDALIQYALRSARHVVRFVTSDQRSLPHPSEITVTPPSTVIHAVDERLMLAEALGVHAKSRRLEYQTSVEEMAAAKAWLVRNVDDSDKRLVGLQIASFPTKAYRDWPVEHVIALCKKILDRYHDVHLLCLGGAEDVEKGQAVAAALAGRCTNIAGKLALRASSAVMAHLSLYIGVDTGPTHVAGALGIPMVALYHCRHRGLHLAPCEHPAALAVIEHPHSDAQCSVESRMSDISVDEVWAAARQILDGKLHGEPATRDMMARAADLAG